MKSFHINIHKSIIYLGSKKVNFNRKISHLKQHGTKYYGNKHYKNGVVSVWWKLHKFTEVHKSRRE